MSFPNALLLDRDGTLIEECHYLSDPDRVRLIPGAGEALKRLSRAGVRLFLVSNQSGIGRGYFSLETYQRVHDRLEELLDRHGVRLDGHAFCPHAPESRCPCRKPRTGMWEVLRTGYGLEPETTAMIGDKRADVQFGRNARLRHVILVKTGHGAREAAALGLPDVGEGTVSYPGSDPERPHLLAPDLAAAAAWLLKGRNTAPKP